MRQGMLHNSTARRRWHRDRLRGLHLAWFATICLSVGCAASEVSPPAAPEPAPTATGAAAPPAAAPPVRANTFEDALDVGFGAATLTQSAQTAADWQLVASQWQRAIALLQSLPADHPQYQAAQAKIAEYQQNLAVAQQRSSGGGAVAAAPPPAAAPSPRPGSRGQGGSTDFLVVAGGGTPRNNEIALEKNVLYFQRTLQALGLRPEQATIFFANGNDGQATVRYLDAQRQERYKAPEIPNLQGAATVANVTNWLGQQANRSGRSLFFYFTGHGGKNDNNLDNNTLILWGDQRLSVQGLAQQFDPWGRDRRIVTMMVQCYSGSFANFIYPQGTPGLEIAAQSRCGFFATIKSNTSVGCTPEVDEADYRDYSSSFFAGLSGRDRTGQAVASADYNRDGQISYAEAHSFAKVDGRTTDLPVSTSEVWLQSQRSEAEKQQILSQPMLSLLATARPEQQYVVETLAQQAGLPLQQSFLAAESAARGRGLNKIQSAYLTRLSMELLNIAIEQQLRASGNQTLIGILNRLLECEATTL